MTRLFFPVLMVATLAFAAGCGASQAHDSTADIINDPSFTPPGQGDLEVADAKPVPEKPRRKPRARSVQQPNHSEFGSLAAKTTRQ